MLFRRCCCLHLSFNPQTFPMRGMKRPKAPKHRLNVHYASARLEKKTMEIKTDKKPTKTPFNLKQARFISLL